MNSQELMKKIKAAYHGSIEEVSEAYLPPAWTEEQEKAFGTVRPTLLIGVGGSGTKSVARLKRKIEKFYKGEQFEEHRKVIRFRVIDTLAYEKLLREDPVTCEVISRDEYCYIGGFNPGQYLTSQLQLDGNLANWWDDSWTPPADTVIDTGAKRVRQLGKLALHHIYSEVERKIGEDINNTVRLYRNLVQRGATRMPGDQTALTIQVYIFSGSCGGTGSGILFDIVYLTLEKIRELQYNPNIRLVIFMPHIFVQLAKQMRGGEWLAEAYEANGYAFFKELQHLITNPRDFFAKLTGGRVSERILPERWKPNRIYLIDTEIAGREIGEPEELYTLAADYFFHYLTTPLGQQVESATANIDERLNSFDRDRPQAFSSPGISYLVYPSKTFGRCLTARLLKEALDVILKPSLSSDEIKSAERRANEFVTQNQDWLSADNIDRKLLERTSTFLSAIPDASQILREGGNKPSETMKRAEDNREAQKTLGKQQIDNDFANLKEKGIKNIGDRLCSEICKLGETSVEFSKQFLANLKEQIEKEKEIKTSSPRKVEDEARNAVEEVRRLENKWLVWKKNAKIEKNVKLFAEKIRESVKLEFALYAAKNRSQYLEEVKNLIDKVSQHLQQIEFTLRTIRDTMNSEKDSFDVYFDESSVTITTQFIPGPPDRATIEKLYQGAKIDVERKAREIFSTDEIRHLLWQLGFSEEKELGSAINTFIRSISELGITPFVSILQKKITSVINENFRDREDFKEKYGHNLHQLADPCWAYSLEELTKGKETFISTLPSLACSTDFPVEEYLPRDLHRTPLPGDPRMVIVLRSDHALPLFAVRGIRIYQDKYSNWLSTFRDRKEAPPHIVKAWNERGALEELSPPPPLPPASKEAFAFGLFLDWLVREKKHENVLKILKAKEGWEHTGPIYERRTYYYFIQYEQEDEYHLRRQGKEGIALGKGRNLAASAVNDDIKNGVEVFKKMAHKNIPDKEFAPLIRDYIDYLIEKHGLSELISLSPGRQEERLKELNEDQRNFKKQLLDEIQILKEYKKDLEGER